MGGEIGAKIEEEYQHRNSKFAKYMKQTWNLFWVFAILVTILFIYKFKRDKRIKNDHIVTCGTIDSIKRGKGGWHINYEFSCQGEIIKSNGSCMPNTKEKFDVGDNNILVVVDKKDCYNCEILETNDDFREFNIITEDTLGVKCRY